jgi:hypothetical protein
MQYAAAEALPSLIMKAVEDGPPTIGTSFQDVIHSNGYITGLDVNPAKDQWLRRRKTFLTQGKSLEG